MNKEQEKLKELAPSLKHLLVIGKHRPLSDGYAKYFCSIVKGLKADVVTDSEEADGLASLIRKGGYDLILVDPSIEWDFGRDCKNALQLITYVKTENPDVYIIALSADMVARNKFLENAKAAGADMTLLKDKIIEIGEILRH